MYFFGKKTGSLPNCGDASNEPKKDGLESAYFQNKISSSMASFRETRDVCFDKKLLQNLMRGDTLRSAKKFAVDDNIKEPSAMLPTELVDALVAGKEAKIHSLEEKISTIAQEFEHTKMKYSDNLKKVWSLGKSSFRNVCQRIRMKNKLKRPSSSPNLFCGRRKEFESLCSEKRNYGALSLNSSRENLFQGISFSPNNELRAPYLVNEMKIQLWIWMERMDEVEKQMLNVEAERDELKKSLQMSFKKCEEMTLQLTSLQNNQAEDIMKSKELSEALEINLENIENCRENFHSIMQSKNDEIQILKESLYSQKGILEGLESLCNELGIRNMELEGERMENDESLSKFQHFNDELHRQLSQLEDQMKDAKFYSEELRRSKGEFLKDFDRWKDEAKEVWDSISKFQVLQTLSSSEISRLQDEVNDLNHKCKSLKHENFNICKQTAEEQLTLQENMKHLECQITDLLKKLKVAESNLSVESSAKAEMLEKLKEMEKDKSSLEENLKNKIKKCNELERDIETIKYSSENDKMALKNTLERMQKKKKEELEVERCKSQQIDLNVVKKKNSHCHNLLLNWESEKSKQNEYILMVEESPRNEIEKRSSKISQHTERGSQKFVCDANARDSEEDIRLGEVNSSSIDGHKIAKSKLHRILKDSLTDIMKKERMIKSLKEDLKNKSDIELRMKATTNKLQSTNAKIESIKKELEDEKEKSYDISFKYNKLIEILAEEKKRYDTMTENLVSANCDYKAKIDCLEEQVGLERMRAVEVAKINRDLVTKLDRMSAEAMCEWKKKDTEIASMEMENSEIKEELERLAKENEKINKMMRVKEDDHQTELEELISNLKEERFKRMKVEEEASNLTKRLEEMHEAYENEVRQMDQKFREEAAKAEERLAEERRNFKEIETSLIKKKDEIAEDLNFIVSYGKAMSPCGDGRNDGRKAFLGSRENELKAEEKMRGMSEFHQRLMDDICRRNLERELALRKAVELEMIRARDEMKSLKRRMKAKSEGICGGMKTIEDKTYSLISGSPIKKRLRNVQLSKSLDKVKGDLYARKLRSDRSILDNDETTKKFPSK